MVKLITWFEDLTKADTPIAGGKGANLGEMIRARIPVPPGFVVTAEAYKEFIETTGLSEKIKNILSKTNVDDPKQLEEAGETIRKIIRDAKIPDNIRELIVEHYRKLCDKLGEAEVFVACRSSATAEDLPEASFAGQQETYLNIHGETSVVENVQKCWASLFTNRVIFYREKQKIDHSKVLMSVVIQKMVNSEAAGVMFTVHPITSEKDKIVIESSWGLGESVVSGGITPDRFIVDKNTFKIIDKQISDKKEIMRTRDSETGKTIEIAIPEDKVSAQSLPDDLVIDLAKIGKQIENHYKFPQDIEWAMENGKLYIVQTRAVTAFFEEGKPAKPVEEKVAGAEEILLKGLGASPGIGIGPVKVVLDVKEIDKVGTGDILATKMTNPDWVPAMKRAAGIVTDEGGVTCFSGGTKILTDTGFMGLKEVWEVVQRGIELKTLSFNTQTMRIEWKRIMSATKRKASLIRVTVSQTGRALKNILDLTEDHKLLSVDRRKLVYEKTVEILTNRKMACVADKIPGQTAQPDPSPDEAYIAGAILSDGSIGLTRTHGSVFFIQKPTPEKIPYINSVKESFQRAFNYEPKEFKKGTSTGFIRGKPAIGTANAYYCTKKDIAERLSSLKKDIVEWVLNVDEETLTNFLASLSDGDGSASIKYPRMHIYIDNELTFQATIVALLRLGILPQVTHSRIVYHIQIVEKLDALLSKTKRLKIPIREKILGTKLFSAKQLLDDIINEVNFKGRIRPYVKNNLLIDTEKIKRNVLPLADQKTKQELERIINADFRMQRIAKIADLGEDDVYNIEVEDNHNYVVFTKWYTPVIVKNCHAAIVSRELGTPCIVGAKNATELLKKYEGQDITVDGTRGVVFFGARKLDVVPATVPAAGVAVVVPASVSQPITATKIYVNLSIPEIAEKVVKESQPDGVGLLRAEHLMLSIGAHPRKLIEEGGAEKMINAFAEGVRKVAEAFYPRPVVYRALDFKPDEFLSLPGGEKYEKETGHVGPNPLIGYRGAFRYRKEPDVFRLECRAIKKVREEYGLKNVYVMIPFVRNLADLVETKKIMEEEGLRRSPDFKLWIMVEVPNTVFLIDKFIEVGIDGISFGTNDLTMLILGIDRDDASIAEIYDERDLGVLRALAHAIRVCNEHGVTTSICGQAPSVYPEYCEFLVRQGATSMSVNPDTVIATRRLVASVEQKITLEKALGVKWGGESTEFKPRWQQ